MSAAKSEGGLIECGLIKVRLYCVTAVFHEQQKYSKLSLKRIFKYGFDELRRNEIKVICNFSVLD